MDAYASTHIYADGDRFQYAHCRPHNPNGDRDCNHHQRANAYSNGNADANFSCISDPYPDTHAIYHTDCIRDHHADSDRSDVYPNAHGDTYTNLGRGLTHTHRNCDGSRSHTHVYTVCDGYTYAYRHK